LEDTHVELSTKALAKWGKSFELTIGYLNGFDSNLEQAFVEQNGDESLSSSHRRGTRSVFR
jgi:hypothetical protein